MENKKYKCIICFLLVLFVGSISSSVYAGVKSDYPVVFAHGMGGFDDILGFDYWGNDYGKFVGNGDENKWLDSSQQSLAASVTPFESSEYRGIELADDIEGYMASVGATHVNIIGHSQGGLDARKAAKILKERKGYRVVRVLISISSPHRGSPVAKYILDMGPGVGSIIGCLAEYFGDSVYDSKNDFKASLKSFVYDDYDPSDGQITGSKVFNQNYPVSDLYAGRYESFLTAQEGFSVNPALYLVRELFYDIDGDGHCTDDCNDDGAAGQGDGVSNDTDDDGLAGINSQQMGYRAAYIDVIPGFGMDYISTDWDRGYVDDLNYPNSEQMTSHSAVINQDHADVIGVGPDTFDEMQFYAAVIDHIDYYE